MNKTISTLIFLFLSNYFAVYSQNKMGSIKGNVIENDRPVEFADVFITTQSDSTNIISGTNTDSLGRFIVDKIPFGNYILNIQFIGYVPVKTSVAITSSNHEIDLKSIEIKVDENVLQSVDVISFRKSIKRTEQGFVINANDNLTQASGNAADLLKNMPTVMVDADGAVTIRGKSPLIMINGRVSGLTGVDGSAQLERIPANNIEKIEINNNPSAKYDANAYAGIINIVLKKNVEAGTNGAFALGLGYGAKERLNGSVMLNHKTNKWNAGLYYNNWYTVRERNVDGERTEFNLQDEHFLTQKRFDSRLVKNQELRLNTDYTPNKYNTLSFNAAWAYNEQDNNETLTSTFRNQDSSFTRSNTRQSIEIRKFNALEFEMNHVKTFNREGKTLTTNVTTSFDDEKENTDINVKRLSEDNVQLGELDLERTSSYQLSNMTIASVDYKQPVSDFGSIETGYKFTFRHLDADYQTQANVNGEYITNFQRSTIFKFREQIHALYAQYNAWVGSNERPKWKYDLGVRGEQVFNSGKTTDQSQDFNKQYFKLFPSANLVFYPVVSDFYRLSYSRRINRPGLGNLNPFVDITDSLNQHSGNPDLDPELINSFELAYNHDWKKASLSFAIFYRQTNNVIMPYLSVIDSGAFLSKPMNFGKAVNYGFEGVLTINTNKIWNANFSYSLYKNEISGEVNQQEIAKNMLAWYTKFINNFSLWEGAKMQVLINYTSPVSIPQGKQLENYYMDMGFQQKFNNDRGRVGIVFTDVFKTQQSGSVVSDDTFYFHRISTIDSRAVLVTLAYTFGTSVKEKLMENQFKNE
ncbi:MAG: TonB-dependent receptor [Prolixibacteraceae bacterium]|jgi:outer membrane receptor protein involved in Fe transport|nr:TonB-dependent receptor [Prolixibacteraceae bacterium]